MLLLSDKPGVYELFNFSFYGFYNFRSEGSELLFDWLDFRVYFESMHGHLRVKAGHVLIAPSEHVNIFAYELY